MKHDIQPEKIGPLGQAMADAVQACVHCGFCLPTCPTYVELGQEMDSPRGRIILMKEVLEGKLEPSEVSTHIDRCLGCVACETACPSGVKYGELLGGYRSHTDDKRPRTLMQKLRRKLALWTLPYPKRFRFALLAGGLGKLFRFATPKELHPMLDLIPEKVPTAQKLQPHYPAKGTKKGTVALLAGCAQQVLAPEINAATIQVLNHLGFDVLVPQTQGCCGALAWHVGDMEGAKRFGKVNLKAFPKDVDAIITNAAGCGSGIHEYKLLFHGTEFEAEATEFVKKAVDVSVFIAKHLPSEFPAAPRALRVAYHDACHLGHAQKVKLEPRAVLRKIPNVTLLEIRDSALCCGSAGIYNIEQPTIAASLGDSKAKNIIDTKCDIVVTGNIGCLVQVQKALQRANSPIKILHTMDFLARILSGKVD